MKKIVYWGAGKICKLCIEQRTEIAPLFLIDSFLKQKTLYGKEIKHPNEIEDWTEYYIVITVRYYSEIELVLKSKGLCKDRDYIWYRDFYLCYRPSIEKNINMIRTYVKNCQTNIQPIMFITPTAGMRNQKSFFTFLKEYIKKRKPNEVIIFTKLEVISQELISREFNSLVVDTPDIFGNDRLEYDYKPSYIKSLSQEECKWLEALEKRKISSNKSASLKYSQVLYIYYKTIIDEIHPSKILIWGNWTRESYILGRLADNYGISHGYMEHGWIPGTIQFDPQGIAGQGVYANDPDILDKIPVTENDIKEIQKIKQYVIEKKLDTRTFYKTGDDKRALEKIDSRKRTVFLIGMDEVGMGMNPQDSYWEHYISGTYKFVRDALMDLIKICTDNNLNLIFKPHPGNKTLDIPEEERNKFIYIEEASIDDLIHISDVVVSIASAVDYKVLIYGKPLVQIGKTGLKGKKCSYEVMNRRDLKDAIIKANEDGMTKEQARNFDQFLAKLLKKYLWDDMSGKEIEYGLTVDTDFCEDKKYECSGICTN